jgi:uncharacterized protein YecE (DUF72 family)
MAELMIGTAGWSVPLRDADNFPAEGSALERYSAGFSCTEINSTFHRPHRPSTFERWAASVPDDFRFAAKLPKTITHQQRLRECEDLLASFVGEVAALGKKLAVLLVQLPPSFAFENELVRHFLEKLRAATPVRIACEPRHASWFGVEADDLLQGLEVARVAADPVKVSEAAQPGGWRGFTYYRLHGSPVPYRSSYEPERLAAYATAIAPDLAAGRDVWCVFDNTASSAATGNALSLLKMLADR